MSQIMVVTEAVQQAGARIQQLSTQIEELIAQLQSTARQVEGDWQGQANSAFEMAMGEWQTAANNIRMAATQIGEATAKAGVNYQDTESANTSMFR